PGAETLANDLSGKSRARQGVGPAIADLALADVPGEIAHAYLELLRTFLAGGAANLDAIRSALVQCHGGEIGDHVRSDVTERIGHLVEQLLLRGCECDAASGPLDLAQARVAVGIDV